MDLTREPLMFPAGRPARLQNLARGDEGWLLGLAYSTQRGYAESHPSPARSAWAKSA
ncbi:Bacterial phosphonate metabolism protein (PhnI) [Chromobacterium violaceum]|uniref:Bacterial phosphonate metabolism protein (PhnI) n=1 Tax=Chromobacterium violaceum TaxID=536 RepID=A0A3S4IF74_CHRVL|nr:Bacterial phosphonate metabolism protein (PhnI) [Chromobacterium violaceum]